MTIRYFTEECKQVLQVTKKPDRAEYKTIIKASAIGILIIGLIGFTLTIMKQLLQ